MEEKQLDLNAPLLSIRKSRPTRQQSLPIPKSHWKQPEPKQPERPEQPEHQLTKPVAVPFNWEQIPGQAKEQQNPQNRKTTKTTANSDRFPSRTTSDNQSSEDIHVDESETLSMSFSYNQSDETSDTESSKSFSTDFQTRDYLMNRFLPAAKSMIIEPPQYVAKKQESSQVPEPPKYEKKVYSGELRPLLLEKYPVNSCYNNSTNNQKKKKKDEESEGECKKKSSRKGFGFFLPRICTKRSSSSCLSNPVNGERAKIHQSQSPVMGSPARPIPRLSRRTSYSGPLTPSLEKQAMDAVILKRAESRSKEVHETQQHKPNPLARSGNSLPSSPHRGSRSGRISPYRNESPRSPFHDGARFLGVPKDVQPQTAQPKSCPSLNVKSHFSPRLRYDSPPVEPEKILYIDWNDKLTNATRDVAKGEPNGDLDAPVRVPPLPKSPSESWLWRTMTLRSPFPKKAQPVVSEKSVKNGPKWETIVKTSNVHHDHVRYSEELLNVSKYTEISF